MTTRNIVQSGYNQIAEVYNKDRHSWSNKRELEDFVHRLSGGSNVLDAGCGAGYASRFLVRRGFEVTGIDISKQMLTLAKAKVPGATFLKMDMRKMHLPRGSFDGVVCLYAIIHIPRRSHQRILNRFNSLLRRGGILLILTGWDDYVGVEEDYLVRGTRMYWSYFDRETNLRMIKQANFEVIWAKEDRKHDGTHFFVLAKKRASVKAKPR